MTLPKHVIRRRTDGCEEPSSCQWLRIVGIDVGFRRDFKRLKLCDFHRECVDLALEEHQRRLTKGRHQRSRVRRIRPDQAIRLHPAGWRAFK